MGSSDTYDVFVSYARSDEGVAAELNGWLCAQGLHTFFDRRELKAGLPWVPALEAAIDRSNSVAILIGKHGIGNTQQYERQAALIRQTRNQAFPVIPVLMPGCDSPPTGFLQLLTWVDLSRGTNIISQTDSLGTLREALVGGPVATASIRASICPYRGLEAFREEDAAFFCGRDKAIDDLVAKVRSDNFVAVVGPSGGGKSSLVFAGLLPALRQESATRTWDVVTLRPGKLPLRALGRAFGTAPENASLAEIDVYLEQQAGLYRSGNNQMLSRIVDLRLDAAQEKPDRLLIYVDQAEELYAMGPGPENEDAVREHADDVEKFLELLVCAGERASVVLTIRVDFYGQLMRSPLVSRLLPAQQVNIRLMRPEDLGDAIVTPARLVGLDFSPPELVGRMLDDLGQQEGRLPLLQFALKEVWERREGNKLTADAYTAVGGVTGAIETTAEDVYRRLNPAQQDAARRLFLSLVTPGEGREDTRARAFVPDDPKLKEIIALFSNSKTRLLLTDFAPLPASAPDGDQPRAMVEVAHEALIQRWPTLKSWVDANRDKLRARAAILRALAEWDERGRSENYLLPRGVQVERGRELLRDPGDVRTDDIRDYVDRSIKLEDDRVAVEQEEAAAKQKAIAEAERSAREAAEQTANEAHARAAAEAGLRSTAERARADAETSARKLRGRLITAIGAFAVAAIFLSFSALLGKRAVDEAKETRRQLDRANQALAESIDNDLDFGRKVPLSPRQRNALWKLAVANATVKQDFVSVIVSNPSEMVRASGGLRSIFRALGQQSPRYVSPVVDAIVGALQTKNNLPALQTLGEALQVLPVKPSDAQTQRALDPILEQIRHATDPNTLLQLAKALGALPVTLTDRQAKQALDPILSQIGQADPVDLSYLVEALGALPVRPSETQTQQLLDAVLKQIGPTGDSFVIESLAYSLQYVAPKLTSAQGQQAVDAVINLIGQNTDLAKLLPLGEAFKALASRLTEAQAQRALDLVLKQIEKSTNSTVLWALGQGLQLLPIKLTDTQAQQALDPLISQVGQKAEPYLGAEMVQALASKLTDAQAQQRLEALLLQIDNTGDGNALMELAMVLQALAPKLNDEQAQQTLGPLLKQMDRTANTNTVVALAGALQDLAPKLTGVHARQAFNAVLSQISKATDADALQAFAQALRVLPGKPNETQARQALDSILGQIGQTTDSLALGKLARALRDLTQTLSKEQLERSSSVAAASLGWAANDDEAAEWARALVALSQAASGSDETLAAVIGYPIAAGNATEVLLDELRRRHSETLRTGTGTEEAIDWLMTNNAKPPFPPSVLRPRNPSNRLASSALL